MPPSHSVLSQASAGKRGTTRRLPPGWQVSSLSPSRAGQEEAAAASPPERTACRCQALWVTGLCSAWVAASFGAAKPLVEQVNPEVGRYLNSHALQASLAEAGVDSPVAFLTFLGGVAMTSIATLAMAVIVALVATLWGAFGRRQREGATVIFFACMLAGLYQILQFSFSTPTPLSRMALFTGNCVMVTAGAKASAAAGVLMLSMVVHVPSRDSDEVPAFLSGWWLGFYRVAEVWGPAVWMLLAALDTVSIAFDWNSTPLASARNVAELLVLLVLMAGGLVGDLAALPMCFRPAKRGKAEAEDPSCCRGVPGSCLLRGTRAVIFGGAMTVVMLPIVFVGYHLDASVPCSPELLGVGVAPANATWPAGTTDLPGGMALAHATAATTANMWYASATATGAAAVLFVVTTQSFIAHQRAKDASQAAARLRSALRYISHEARSPLGGAILSLSLISDAIDESNAAESKALLGDLHVSLEAAKRHLDDLLLFEKVTSKQGGGESGGAGGGAFGWDGFGPPTLRRQTSAFRGACQAEGIHIAVTASGGRMDVAGTLAGWPLVPRGTSSVTGCGHGWEVYANWQRLDAIVQNAVSNSVKHAPGGRRGRIAVSVSLVDASVLDGRRPVACPPEAAGQRRPSVVAAAGRLALSAVAQDGAAVGGAVVGGRADDKLHHGVAAPPRAGRAHVQTAAGAASRHPASTVWRRSAFTSHAAPAPAVEPIEAKVLVIEVLDNGKGIPAEMLRPGRLFRPFQQLRMGDSALRMTSSGLGLSIVKSVVVDQMGGDVGLASREGEGTLFFARVPVWARRCGGDGEGGGGCDERDGNTAQVDSGSGAQDSADGVLTGDSAGRIATMTSSTAFFDAPSAAVVGLSSDAEATTPSHARAAIAMTPPEAPGPGPRSGLAASTDVTGSKSLLAKRVRGRQSGGAAVTPGSQSREDRQGRRERRLAKRSGERRAGNDGAPPLPLAWVVDDERVNRTLMARVIRKWGFEVLEFGDGAELVEAVEGMPRMGGSDAMAALAAIRSRLESAGATADAAGLAGVRVIGVTGQAVEEDRDRLSAMGACCVLTKPVAPRELARVVAAEVASVSLPATAFGHL
ncbi:hypothetical protein FNF29_08436 [Cafeteria roenbergensis]|uniref:histidine kinase n=1 Tax=Cafeteria roenbergensis TaxID=33653 RepID=A0A5A8BZI4_CAFRO|nr:hypothetical protein FNF29_08436 [Cafeteria roenbergensis]|eukprot:KAA0145679.1 hypothetical protein FNF29_08436 [Cafeteria roenbergensis]